MIISHINGEWRNVGSHWVEAKQNYVYKVHSMMPYGSYEWARAAEQIDKAIVDLVHQKLLVTFNTTTWDATLNSFQEACKREQNRIIKQISALERVMQNLIKSLNTLDDEDMIKGAQAQYREAKAEHNRLNSDLEKANDETSKLEAIISIKDDYYGPAMENWPSMTRDEKVRVIRAFVHHVEATPIDDNGLQLTVVWRDQSRDEVRVIRRHQGGYDWLQSELQHLLHLVESQATQLEIAAAFPDRTWDQLRRRYCRERGIGSLKIEPKPIKDKETYEMYLTRVNSPRPAVAQSGEKWTKEDVQLLAELVDQGANQVQIAEAFPTRRWVLIWLKIKKLRGKNVVIPGVGQIKRNETIRDYYSRIGKAEYNLSVRSMTFTTRYLV